MARSRISLLIAVSLLATSCYLPRADIQRDVEELVLASVYQCSTASVGGVLRNDADVSVRVELVAMWLDLDSEVHHEAELTVPRVQAESEQAWTVDSGAEVAPPLLCTVEMSSVEVTE